MRTGISCQDVMVSASNNSLEVLTERTDGRTSSLAGGHFTAGAWAPVTLYDYHLGADFAREGLELRPPLFGLINDDLARRFLSLYGDEDFSAIDFRQFSRHVPETFRAWFAAALTMTAHAESDRRAASFNKRRGFNSSNCSLPANAGLPRLPAANFQALWPSAKVAPFVANGGAAPALSMGS